MLQLGGFDDSQLWSFSRQYSCKQLQIRMATFNTYDYDFLVKCLAQGSTIFKAQAIKRLTTLAGADKKQFVNNLRLILSQLEKAYKQDKQEINYQSLLLLNEIISNIQSKQLASQVHNRHLPLVIPALGHQTKTILRKAAHTVLLNCVKTYQQFTNLSEIYLNFGFLSQNQLVQQKSINSFQSILILQVKHFDWESEVAKRLVQTLIFKIDHQNLFVSKAASQCILSICKMQGIKTVVNKLSEDCIKSLKKFLQEIVQKLPTDSFCITPNDLNRIIQQNFKAASIRRYQPKQKIRQPQPVEADEAQEKVQIMKNNSNHRRLQKIKRSIKNEEKKIQKQMIGGKLFSFISGEGTLKERTQAMQDLLYKIQISKNKPEFESSMKAVFPTLLKMLKDTNPKIVSLTLRILQNCIEWISTSTQQLNNLVSIIVQKLGDQKISIRQNVSKVIKDLSNKTDKSIWIKELIQNLSKNTSTVLKDQTLYLVHYIYENCQPEEELNVPTAEIVDQISYYTQDPKTKIKIRALDCLSVIVYHSKQPEKYNFALKGKMSSVFYQMYLQKIDKLKEQFEKRRIEKEKKNKREGNEKLTQQSFRSHYRDQNDAKSQGDNQSEPLNISMQTIKRRVSLLRKPRNLLSTQQTISVDGSYHRTIDKSTEDVQIVLPSLYKKTGNKFLGTKRGQVYLNKTIDTRESKEVKGDYLSKQDLKPLRDPEKQIRVILSDLKSSDWKVQFEATNKLRRMIQFHPNIITQSPVASIHSLSLDLIGMAQNLRSSVSKNSLICINQFILLMGKQIDPEMDILMQKLIKKSADTNTFISNQVQKSLNTLAVNATSSKVLEKLACFRDSKSSTVKQAIVIALVAMKDNEKIRQKQFAKLAQSLAYYLTDSQVEVRSRSKNGIIELAKDLGDWYRALRGKINPIYFKSICELMTKSPSMRKQDLNQTIQAKSLAYRKQMEQKQEKHQKMEAPPLKRKPTKVSQFPPEFNQIPSILEGNNSSDWKKRMQAVDKVKEIALKYHNQFSQFRSATYFLDAICKQVVQPNIKVSTNSLSILFQIYQPLKLTIQSNLGIVCNSVFAALSSNKQEVRELAQKFVTTLIQGTDVQMLMQHLCHGVLYALPRSRVYLLSQLEALLQNIYEVKKQILFKSVFPLLNKLMDEYKSQLMPTVVSVFDKLYQLMGNQMFSHLTKFKQVRELIDK